MLFHLCLVGLFGCKDTPNTGAGNVCRGVDANGCKSGVGLVLTENSQSNQIAIEFYVLDPDHPGDFGHGVRYPSQVQMIGHDTYSISVRYSEKADTQFRLELGGRSSDGGFEGTITELSVESTPITMRFVKE